MLSLHLEITLGVITATVGGLLLAGKAARASSSVGGVLAERDVALGVTADHERWGVDHLLGHTDVALADHDTGHVDGLGNTKLEDLGLQAALEQTLGGQLKHEIELLLGVVEESVADQAADEGVTLEDAGLVRLRERKEHTGGLTDLGEHELGAPDLALAAKTIFTTELELLVKTLLAERTARGLEGFAVVTPFSGGDHGS
eukprot:CAMPEP_0195525190 /NCGR_PEP_ID=MMETSP0794_2-20130614/25485_1 /TAXON_ID=515487 /ORGANISM="Stephanopyxis turris, Strain CCMP 815" /LENGTH=200 /DNA_ID=CAMNT_0040655587 /DNA_START=82 /DNA_END=684 /DNA_ORIENTATION=-